MDAKTKQLKWNFPKYRGRWVYRVVELDPRDLERLENISKRLNEFYLNAEIMHARDYDKLKAIITALNKAIKIYKKRFEAHSFEDVIKKRKKGGDSGKLIRAMRDDRANRISWPGSAKGIGPFTKGDELDEH